MTEQMWKTFGEAGSGLRDMVKMAAEDGVEFPLPDDVIKYIKGFQ